jgi:uncharacterized membrane protein YjjP (DUF1212 family)
MSARRLEIDLLLQAGRQLLEYNESTEAIHRALISTAKSLTGKTCHVAISYRGVAIALAGESQAFVPIRELRYNNAVLVRIHEILNHVRSGNLEPSAALENLQCIEATSPKHARWLSVLVFGVAAACLGIIASADWGGCLVAGLSAAVGLWIRQELGRRHFSLLTLPLAAASIGAVFGGLAIRAGWTRTPELVVLVPALMLVPGPHFINALLDLIDNFLPMCLSRLGLAMGILLASALGIVLGIELTLAEPMAADSATASHGLNLVTDMALAGVVTCGFAVFYNTPWRLLGPAAVGGMAGHGLRFLGLGAGLTLIAATFIGGTAVGAISAWMTRTNKTPVAVIAFAGAVTMIPGLSLYRALAGALRLARSPEMADTATAASTFGHAVQGCVVAGALALGLIVGARLVLALMGERVAPTPSIDHTLTNADFGSKVESSAMPKAIP